ncbi:MAG: ABC transporter permease [Thermodesulfobacteriota bacterium]
MNLAVRDIWHQKSRFLQTCLGLGLLLGVVMSMLGIYRGLIAEALSILDRTGADLWVVQQHTNGPFAATSRLPEAAKDRVRAVPGVAQASPLSFQNIQIERHGAILRFFLVGYEPGGLGGPQGIVAGRGINRKHHEIVVDQALGIPLGDSLALAGDRYTVVGHTRGMVSSGGDPAAFVTLADAQEVQFKNDPNAIRNERARLAAQVATWEGISPAERDALPSKAAALASDIHIINALAVRLNPSAGLGTTRERIDRWSHLRAISDAEQRLILTEGMIQKAKKQIGLFSVILLAISTVIISLIIYTMTLDKLRVIATLKLIGAQNRVIVGLILQQSLLMGAIAYGLGYGLTHLTYDRFPRRVELLPFDLERLFVIVMAICVLASLAGIRKAMRVDPAQALGR